MSPEELLEKVTKGTTTYRHRNNPLKINVRHMESKDGGTTWALVWWAGSSYGCGYGPEYVPGWLSLVLVPEHTGRHVGSLYSIWDGGRDEQGPVTKKRLQRIIEVIRALEPACERSDLVQQVRHFLAQEFPTKFQKGG